MCGAPDTRARGPGSTCADSRRTVLLTCLLANAGGLRIRNVYFALKRRMRTFYFRVLSKFDVAFPTVVTL